MHDDLQVMRVYEMKKCLLDLQIPCRWVPDMGFGYGYPQFQYYGPLPYYFMGSLAVLGLDYLTVVKIGFISALLLGNITMYFLGNFLYGPWGGLLSAIAYAYLPFRSSDVYSRGAMGESWAFVFLPLIVLFTTKFLRSQKPKSFILASISLSLLFITHNVTTLTFGPLLATMFFTVGYLHKVPFKKLLIYFSSLVGLAIALAGSFFLPAYIEKNLVHTESLTSGYFNFLAHFVSLKQSLFTYFWGYGSSEIGPTDDLSFMVGPFHLILLLLVLIKLLSTKSDLKLKLQTILFILLSLISLFMTHQKSSFIWQSIPVLSYLQFPWRYLVTTTFFVSIAIGYLFLNLNSKLLKVILVVLIVLFNVSFFRPIKTIDITPAEKIIGNLWQKQLTISIFDYLPKTADLPPTQKAPLAPYFSDPKNNGAFFEIVKTSNRYDFSLKTTTGGTVVVPVFNYPGWQVEANNKKKLTSSFGKLGLVSFNVDPGTYQVKARFRDTPFRTTANIISLIAVVLCLSGLLL